MIIVEALVCGAAKSGYTIGGYKIESTPKTEYHLLNEGRIISGMLY